MIRVGAVALVLLLAAGVMPAAAQDFEVAVLQDTGPAHNRINLAILGDGYRTQDQSKLLQDAQNLLSTLFSRSPYREYRGLFNATLVHVVSRENGADNGSYGAVRDTALDANFRCFNVDRLLCVSNSKAYQIAAKHVPAYTFVLVLVNDPMYGGSGGPIAVSSTHPSAALITTHELGHTISGLADEYETPYPGYPACSSTRDCSEPNATLRNTRSTLKWSHWVSQSTPIPTPKNAGHAGVGLFEGARYLSKDIYRPVENACLMRSLEHHGCPVCSEAMALSYWNRVSPIDGIAPASSVSVRSCDPRTFSVQVPALDQPPLTYSWTLNGSALPDLTGPEVVFPAGTLPPGNHRLSVVVTDPSTLVRRDPGGLTIDEAIWNVSVSSCSLGTFCSSGAQCDSGFCVDGVCCESACTDQCAACNVASSPGFCVPVAGPPSGGRAPCTSNGSICGGTCDGVVANRCSYPSAARCREASCINDALSPEAFCDGAGRCPQELLPCEHGCEDAQCQPECVGDEQCAEMEICVEGSCHPDPGGGEDEEPPSTPDPEEPPSEPVPGEPPSEPDPGEPPSEPDPGEPPSEPDPGEGDDGGGGGGATPRGASGCGCTSGPPSVLGLAALALTLLRRRRPWAGGRA